MSTGPEHYKMAEDLIENAEQAEGDDVPDTLQAAEVHAILALTAALVTSLPLLKPNGQMHAPGGMTGEDAQAWADVIA